MSIDVVVAGYLCIDLIPHFHGAPRAIHELFRPGALIDVEGMTMTLGGVVANSGLALKKFGCSITPMGLVGEDALGEMVVNLLINQGLTAAISRSKDAKTSFSVVLAPPGTDRIFLECCGANDLFSAADLDTKMAGSARIFHLGYPPLMRRMWNQGGAELADLLEKIHGAGAVTSVDMAMMDPRSPAGSIDWKELLKRVLPHVDLFVPSFEELAFMLQPRHHAQIVSSPDSRDFVEAAPDAMLEELAQWVLAHGAALCLIKAGKRGLHVSSGDASALIRSGRLNINPRTWSDRSMTIPALPLSRPLVTALGAGDAAVAGFLAALLRGETIERSLMLCAMAGRDSLYGIDPVGTLRGWEQMIAELDILSPAR